MRFLPAGIECERELARSAFVGPLFEGVVASEIVVHGGKQRGGSTAPAPGVRSLDVASFLQPCGESQASARHA